jgi:MFS family permease
MTQTPPLTTEKPKLLDDPLALRTILIGTLIVLLAMGIRATIGLFIQPMGLERGWGREIFSMAFAIQNLAWGFGAIGAGMMADRLGAGRTIALCAALYALGLLGTRYSSTELDLYLSAGLLIGLGQAGTTFAVILPVIARTVPVASRSTAMGIASAGGSLGQFLVVPTGQLLIDTLNWTGAYWVLSMTLAMTLPLAWFLRGTPGPNTGPQQSMLQAISQALRHPTFHLIFWGYFVCGFHTAFITLHLPAFVVDKGLNRCDCDWIDWIVQCVWLLHGWKAWRHAQQKEFISWLVCVAFGRSVLDFAHAHIALGGICLCGMDGNFLVRHRAADPRIDWAYLWLAFWRNADGYDLFGSPTWQL